MGFNWIVIQTKASREIQAAMEITSLGFKTFYPLHERKRIHNHKVEHISGPLFPRYIFAKLDRDQSEWGGIKTRKSVSYILSDCMGRPYILPDQVIEAMKNRLDAPEEVLQADPIYTAHQKVRVKDGLLQGLEGLFEGSSANRTKALLEIMGKRWEVPMDMIEAA